MKVVRGDPYLHSGPGTNCGIYSGNPVYQSMWFHFSDGEWLELGTGDSCNGITFLFWGWGSGYQYHSLGTDTSAGPGDHEFVIRRQSIDTQWWNFKLDQAIVDTFQWDGYGTHVVAGLESYDPDAFIARHTYRQLQRERYYGGWVYWSGQDGMNVGPTPTMCGEWGSNDHVWAASENMSCH